MKNKIKILLTLFIVAIIFIFLYNIAYFFYIEKQNRDYTMEEYEYSESDLERFKDSSNYKKIDKITNTKTTNSDDKIYINGEDMSDFYNEINKIKNKW